MSELDQYYEDTKQYERVPVELNHLELMALMMALTKSIDAMGASMPERAAEEKLTTAFTEAMSKIGM